MKIKNDVKSVNKTMREIKEQDWLFRKTKNEIVFDSNHVDWP